MFLDISSWDWCHDGSGVIKAMSFIKSILNIIRWIVPIGLIAYTSYEMLKKVIKPDDKDSMKHVVNRVIAAIIVFFVPLIVKLTLRIVDIGMGNNSASGNSLGTCWEKAKG